MDAVTPVAGRGTRLGEITDDRPKGLVDVVGRSLLTDAFETAVEAGADGLVVVSRNLKRNKPSEKVLSRFESHSRV